MAGGKAKQKSKRWEEIYVRPDDPRAATGKAHSKVRDFVVIRVGAKSSNPVAYLAKLEDLLSSPTPEKHKNREESYKKYLQKEISYMRRKLNLTS